MKLIEHNYIKTLIEMMHTPDIKVITGVRRWGKSKLLEAFVQYAGQGGAYNPIHINLMEEKNAPLVNAHSLYEHVSARFLEGRHNLVCIDEIQLCENFERVVSWLHAEEKYDIYITGSNEFLLSSNLATLFTGRTFAIDVYPFSFEGGVRYYGCTDKNAKLDAYLERGGMARSYLYAVPERKRKYVQDVYQTLIVSDIKQKFKIHNSVFLDSLTDFMIDNIGPKTSICRIADMMTSARMKTLWRLNFCGGDMRYMLGCFMEKRLILLS